LQIKIALCEDTPHDQRETERLLQLWEAQSGHRINIHAFSDTSKLSGAIDDAFERFDVYFLDIEMRKPLEGLEFAKTIRRQSQHVPIVFVTSHKELSYESHEVQALHFIAKPIDPKRLFETMDRLVKLLESRETTYFSFSIDRKKMSLPIYEILFMSTYEQDSHYITINGDPERRFLGKLSDIVKEHKDNFVLCHQSYLVNLDHLRVLLQSTLRLSDGTELPISKAQLSTVRRRFAEFHRSDSTEKKS